MALAAAVALLALVSFPESLAFNPAIVTSHFRLAFLAEQADNAIDGRHVGLVPRADFGPAPGSSQGRGFSCSLLVPFQEFLYRLDDDPVPAINAAGLSQLIERQPPEQVLRQVNRGVLFLFVLLSHPLLSFASVSLH
jgi:hypothetical protein